MKLPNNATTYVVFGASLTVAYAISRRLNVTSATIDLVELFAANDSLLSTVTTFNLPVRPEMLSGEFTLTCGTIDHAGRYRLQLNFDAADTDSGSTRTGLLDAVWPTLVVSLPATHVVLDSDVRVSVTVPRADVTTRRMCASLHADPGRFILELVYFGRVETRNGQRVVEPRKVSDRAGVVLSALAVITQTRPPNRFFHAYGWLEIVCGCFSA